MRWIEFFRLPSVRIALLYAGLFSLSAAVLFVVIYQATAGATARQLAESINADAGALETEYQVGGINEVIAEIAIRLGSGADTSHYYLLQAPDGRRLTGNLGPFVPLRLGWTDIHLTSIADGAAANRHILAKGIVLPDGVYLMAGQDARPLDELEGRITQAFLWATVATLILAAAGAGLVSRVSLRRIEAINRATEEIMAGNFSRRIPVHSGADEFDRLSAQVNLMLDRIQSLMNGLQQVSNDIAHDLKTPLGRLRQRLELARQPAAGLADMQAAVDQAVAECDVILSIFDALLRIAQIESGSRRAGFRLFDLSLVVETIFDAYQPVAEETGHWLTACAEGGAWVRGDRQLVTQMVSNLVENALKHTPAGCRISLGAAILDGECRMTVGDNGPGIPEGERDKVFRRFYRLDEARSTAGSGLGLSLVAAVAQLHEATVCLSDDRPGLRVTVAFRHEAPADGGAGRAERNPADPAC